MHSLSILLLFSVFSAGYAIWCYECVSTQPGCGRDFTWLWHWTRVCPEDDDICVKITETKGSEEIITRSCLSSMRFRKDIPPDHYEGCRPGVSHLQLGHYVNQSVKELDIRRDMYKATWCFCFLDHRCNSAAIGHPSLALGALTIVTLLYRYFVS